ncbi:MAG: MFS transporter [Leucobacter sp.]
MRFIINNFRDKLNSNRLLAVARPDPAAPMLLGAQVMFNIGFYAVVPFLAIVLADDFLLGGAAVGLVLGIRTFSQQGMFLIGGMMSDRLGAKTVILVGCGVRAAGFLTLSASLWPEHPSLPPFIAGTVLTGLGGAMFSPALNTLVSAAEAHRGSRRGRSISLFAWLVALGEVGAAIGPLVGAALFGWGFVVVAVTGAALFTAIAVILWRFLPSQPRARRGGARGERRAAPALRDRRFVAFAVIHAVDLLAYNQLYLSFPTELRRVGAGAPALGLIFAWVSVLTILLQLPVSRWSNRFPPATTLRIGYLSSACGFLVLAICAPWPPPVGWALGPAFAAVTLLALGHLFAVPTALGAVSSFSGTRQTGSYFGLLATTGGIAVLLGNLGIGALLDAAAAPRPSAVLPWLVLAALSTSSALLVGSRWIWSRPASGDSGSIAFRS